MPLAKSKVNIQVLDVVCVEARKISKEVRKYLKEGDVSSLNRGKLPLPQAKHQKLLFPPLRKHQKVTFPVSMYMVARH